ncbi:MAG TPA: phosphoribosylanthranilate isomerase [Polyangiaceae bacterium]|nr:phosphoribosylanthranilate isomerase [Polyangiaceae bacterium]
MTGLLRTRIKACCIASITEARIAIQAGASAIGLMPRMPDGPGVLSEAEVREIAEATPPGVTSVLLTTQLDVDQIVTQQRGSMTHTLQLCAPLTPDARLRLRRELPGVRLLQVVHIEGEESVAQALDVQRTADALLLDTQIKRDRFVQLGGTGLTHDWAISERIVKQANIPVFLAGGLRATNVAEAIRRVRPFGVDVCTGIRAPHGLDPEKLEAFVTAVAEAS